jgi:hypothetical protein
VRYQPYLEVGLKTMAKYIHIKMTNTHRQILTIFFDTQSKWTGGLFDGKSERLKKTREEVF